MTQRSGYFIEGGVQAASTHIRSTLSTGHWTPRCSRQAGEREQSVSSAGTPPRGWGLEMARQLVLKLDVRVLRPQQHERLHIHLRPTENIRNSPTRSSPGADTTQTPTYR